MMYPCRQCEFTPPEKKIQAPIADISTTLGYHLGRLQSRLTAEFERIASERERELQQELARLRQGNSAAVPVAIPAQGVKIEPKQLSLGSSLASPRVPQGAPAQPEASLTPSTRLAATTRQPQTPCAEPIATAPPRNVEGSPLQNVPEVGQEVQVQGVSSSGGVTINAEPFDTTNTHCSLPSEYHMFALWPVWKPEAKTSRNAAEKIFEHHRHTVLDLSGRGHQQTEAAANQRFKVHLPNLCRGRAMNPASPFPLVWTLLFCVVLLVELMLIPIKVFNIPEEGFLQGWSWGAAFFWTADLALSFCMGYLKDDGHAEQRLRLTARKYLKSWFVPDFIIVSLDWLALTGLGRELFESLGLVRVFKALRGSRVIRLMRVVRLRKLGAMNQIDDMVNSQYFTILKSICVNMMVILLTSHFVGCIWYWVGTMNVAGYPSWVTHYHYKDKDWFYSYLTSLHWSLTQFTPGSMNVQPLNPIERAVAILVLVLGMILFSSIVSSITQATNKLKDINGSYNKQVWLLRRYFRQNAISLKLMSRVTRYSDAIIRPRYCQVSHADVELLRLLPTSVYLEVMRELYQNHLQVHPFFMSIKRRNRRVFQLVCSHCLQNMMVPKLDEVFTPGLTAHWMYFVKMGNLVYTIDHADISEPVSPGSWCCEMVLWTPWTHQGTMRTNDDCELIALESEAFRDVVARHRIDLGMLSKYGAEYVRRMNEIAGFHELEEGPTEHALLSDLLQIDSAIHIVLQDDEDIEPTSPDERFSPY
jgi:hypothetical protein